MTNKHIDKFRHELQALLESNPSITLRAEIEYGDCGEGGEVPVDTAIISIVTDGEKEPL